MAAKTESFEEMCGKFAVFLSSQGRPSALRWFCREDVTGYRRRVRVVDSSYDANHALYESYYRYGIARGMGLSLEASFFIQDLSWCHIWCPQDEFDASQAMMGGAIHFKLSTHPPQTTTHGSFAFTLWSTLDKLRGVTPFLASIPRRSWLQTLNP